MLVYSLLYWFTRSHGKFSVCPLEPKTDTFCFSATARHSSPKFFSNPHWTPLKVFLRRQEHINLWKRLLLSSLQSTVPLCFIKKGHGLTYPPCTNVSESVTFVSIWTTKTYSMLQVLILPHLLLPYYKEPREPLLDLFKEGIAT